MVSNTKFFLAPMVIQFKCLKKFFMKEIILTFVVVKLVIILKKQSILD